ncbi:tyrosine-type recombinase/integrase [Natronobacterium gregoryi]|uniref:Integrase family protein n=2 Tax=Natronobacterium gregoryi TaxID=44930 RepID=L0AGQ5_NATGS|nr:tyrosine-type recombinase/integrase [Natronobacterium gregoryi]AFZ73083.1 site-specific recombinase XerD [Natronobacterium gregoryi SP2]ELY70817.1 integrase family protein [Natronobacterium gregoryi SP2]PLK20396.1 site-specific integrase [Natronobacterium gregoryi SP2]SFI61528.1 Site-specific recombinase XerD [Natronobacterium gregoryi]
MTDSDPREEVDTLRQRLRSNGEDARYVQYDTDRRHLLKFSDNIRLVPSEIGDHRHLKLLRHCTRMATLATPPSVEDFEDNDEADDAGVDDQDDVDELLEDHGLLGAALEYRAVAETIVRWINSEYDNEHTNQDYRTALRSFGRYRQKRDEPPETLAWIPTGTSNDFDPVPSERDLLTWNDLQDLINAARNPRDEALLAVQFEAGLRGGELYDLQVGDVFDSDHSVGIHVNGKEGERSVHLISSVPYLQRWLDEHPASDDDQAWLWSKLSSSDRPSYPTFLNYFKYAAERVDISKDVTPTAFRKANTRWLVTQGFSTARIEDRQGRKRGSDHTSRYMARFGEESNENAYARLHGIEVESEEPEQTGPIECPRCHRDTPRDKDFCMWCHNALSFEATEKVDAVDDDVAESIAESAQDEGVDVTPEEMLEARKALEENPELKQLLLPD